MFQMENHYVCIQVCEREKKSGRKFRKENEKMRDKIQIPFSLRTTPSKKKRKNNESINKRKTDVLLLMKWNLLNLPH